MIHHLYFTLGFIVLFLVLVALGNDAGGWDGLTYIIAALGTAALWALASIIFMTLIIVRERGRRTRWRAMGTLGGILTLIGIIAVLAGL